MTGRGKGVSGLPYVPVLSEKSQACHHLSDCHHGLPASVGTALSALLLSIFPAALEVDPTPLAGTLPMQMLKAEPLQALIWSCSAQEVAPTRAGPSLNLECHVQLLPSDTPSRPRSSRTSGIPDPQASLSSDFVSQSFEVIKL